MKQFVLLLSFVVSASITHAADNLETCGEIQSPVKYKYCYTTNDKSTSQTVLFYLHGGGGDEHEWTGISNEINNQWSANGINAPVIVNVSFGPYWILVANNGSPQSGLLDVFKNNVIPQMENLILGRPAQERWLLGLSMGGFNGTQVLGNFPAGTFKRAVLACPAIVDLSPWASDAEITAYANAHGSDLNTLRGVAQIAQPFVPDTRTWDSLISPFSMLNAISVSVPALFIATNQNDDTFGYGGSLFAQKIGALKSDLKFEKWSGGHCQLDSVAIANFLTQ